MIPIIGALVIGAINNGLSLRRLEYSQELIASGGTIVLSVGFPPASDVRHRPLSGMSQQNQR